MIPHKQRFRHDPDNGVWGDCWRTAIACLFDLEPGDVPHFGDGGPSGDEMGARVDAWLKEQGCHRVMLAFPAELDDVLRTVGYYNPNAWYLLTGRSRTGVDHVVICRNNKIEHDPSLDDAGIVGPGTDDVYWVEFVGGPQGIAPKQSSVEGDSK